MTAHNLVASYAHEVVQMLPLSAGRYKCVQCKKEGTLAEMFSKAREHRCRPHNELASSGWRHEVHDD